MARYWPQFNVPGVVSGVVLEELHRVAIATVAFFCLTEALGSDRKARFVESMDAIPSAATVRVSRVVPWRRLVKRTIPST